MLNLENISRPLSRRVKKKFVEMKKSSRKLESVCYNREACLEDLTRKYIQESSVLTEELYRAKNIEGYKPTNTKFLNKEVIGSSTLHKERNPRRKKGKSLTLLYDELNSFKNEFVRRRANALDEIKLKSSISKHRQYIAQQRSNDIENKLSILNKGLERSERKEDHLDKLESKTKYKSDTVEVKKEKLKRMKHEIERNLKNRRLNILPQEHTETSLSQRRHIRHLDKVVEYLRRELEKVVTQLRREEKFLNELYFLEASFLEKKEEMSRRIEVLLFKLKNLRKKRRRREQQRRQQQLEKLKRKKKKRKKKRKKEKPQKMLEIPEINITSLNQDKNRRKVELEEMENLHKKEIQDVADEVKKFKKDFTFLFAQIDVVKERMKFYNTSPKSSARKVKQGPQGLVAIVITDVQNSTHLWELDIESMRISVQLHNDVARSIIEKCEGYEVRTEGDSFIIAFPKVYLAIRFAVLFQLALMKVEWPEKILCDPCTKVETGDDGTTAIFNGLRVRIGIHFGKPIIERDTLTGRDDYFGPMMNKAHLIECEGRGGIIAISEAVFKFVKGAFGTHNDREIQKQRFGSRVHMKLLGFKSLGEKKQKGGKKKKGGRKREIIRWIVPYSLRGRYDLVKTKKMISGQYSNMGSLVDDLKKKRAELDRKRDEIHNRLNHRIQLKALNASSHEKENIIVFLKKKISCLTNTYEKALEGRKNPFIEEEEQILIDMKNVMNKYNRLTDVYKDMKKNFGEVENVFSNRLRDELDRFKYELNEVTHKLSITECRNQFNRKVWRIEKGVLNTKIEDKEATVREKQVEIFNLERELEQKMKDRDEFFRRGSNVVHEEMSKELLDQNDDDDDDNKNFDELDGTGTIDTSHANFDESERKKRELSDFCLDDPVFEKFRGQKEEVKDNNSIRVSIISRNNVVRLPYLGEDEMIVGNDLRLYSVLNKKRHDQMAVKDILMLKKLKKAFSHPPIFRKLRQMEISAKESRHKNMRISCFSGGQQKEEGLKKGEDGRFVFFEILSKRKKREWIDGKVQEIRAKYRKLIDTDKWNGSHENMRKMRSILQSIHSDLRSSDSPSIMTSRSICCSTISSNTNYSNYNSRRERERKQERRRRYQLIIKKNKKKKKKKKEKDFHRSRPQTASARMTRVSEPDDEDDNKSCSSSSTGGWKVFHKMNMKINSGLISSRKRRGFVGLKKSKSSRKSWRRLGEARVVESYSRLLQKLPTAAEENRRRNNQKNQTEKCSNEKRGIVEVLYYDKNAMKYSNILPK